MGFWEECQIMLTTICAQERKIIFWNFLIVFGNSGRDQDLKRGPKHIPIQSLRKSKLTFIQYYKNTNKKKIHNKHFLIHLNPFNYPNEGWRVFKSWKSFMIESILNFATISFSMYTIKDSIRKSVIVVDFLIIYKLNKSYINYFIIYLIEF